MDKEAHAAKVQDPSLSYNDIDWTLIKSREIEGGIEKIHTTPLKKPLIRYNM